MVNIFELQIWGDNPFEALWGIEDLIVSARKDNWECSEIKYIQGFIS